MGSSGYAGIIHTEACPRGDGYWVITSDLPGLLLCGKDLNALLGDISSVIKALYRLNYNMMVEVTPLTEATALFKHKEVNLGREYPTQWAAIPA